MHWTWYAIRRGEVAYFGSNSTLVVVIPLVSRRHCSSSSPRASLMRGVISEWKHCSSSRSHARSRGNRHVLA